MWDADLILLSPEHQIKTAPAISGYKAESHIYVHSSTMDRWVYKEGPIDFSPKMSGHSIAIQTAYYCLLFR